MSIIDSMQMDIYLIIVNKLNILYSNILNILLNTIWLFSFQMAQFHFEYKKRMKKSDPIWSIFGQCVGYIGE
jgi:hypothetical protein